MPVKYAQQRSTGKRDDAGNMIMRTVQHSANASVDVQVLENTFLRQTFQMARDTKQSERAALAEQMKHEGLQTQCETLSVALSKVSDVL